MRPADVVVTSPAGGVRGLSYGDLAVFRGVPYAEAPEGPLRFRAPVRRPRRQGVRDATEFGAAAPQPPAAPGAPPVWRPESGLDCLNLNIWTPRPGEAGLPVMCGSTAACGSTARRACRSTTGRHWPERASWWCRRTTASASRASATCRAAPATGPARPDRGAGPVPPGRGAERPGGTARVRRGLSGSPRRSPPRRASTSPGEAGHPARGTESTSRWSSVRASPGTRRGSRARRRYRSSARLRARRGSGL